ncbi:MAG: prevent-host-death protein [Spirochaetales bacterium]|nr:prevent-host-death protein [Spirochaetales bacterium]
MTYIKPSAAIRNDYNSISSLCRESESPVYLTKNGEGDLVVMDIKTFDEREKVLKLREDLLETEELRLRGLEDHSPEETLARMKDALTDL